MVETNWKYARRISGLLLAMALLALIFAGVSRTEAQTTTSVTKQASKTTVIQYLEIVTPKADAVCRAYEQLHGVTFGKRDANLGNAGTAQLPNGGLLGVRAPLRATEQPIVRPYLLVDNIEASVAKAQAAGAQIALPPMELPGHGKCSIFIQGGVEHGLWEAQDTSK